MTLNELYKLWAADRPQTMHLYRRATEYEILGKRAMTKALLAGDEVPIPGIGKLKVKERPARKGRNPQTGEVIDIPAKKKIVLVMSKTMNDLLNGKA